MIQVDRLTKSYGPVTAVHDVSFNVEKGQIVGFLGPNGAGKSTTMKILACFMAASGGSARVAGFDVFTQSLEVRRRIGYLPENSPLYADLPVAAYLDFVAEAKGVSRGVRRSKVADVMDRCFVTEMQHRLIGKLSKGYRQRVGLAQALLGDPEVLILDEPTIGLDPRQIAEIRALIKSLGGQHTVILSTHILPEVSMVCDSIIIINRGRVVAKGTQAELVEQVFPAARVEVEVAGPAEAIASALKSLPGVTSVEAIGVEAIGVEAIGTRYGASRFVVESPRGRDVRGELVRLVAGRGWELLELHQVGLSLEEVFIRVVAGEEHAPQVLESVVDTAQ
jgi:ABC-2 type transport system ATP-binding protein